ncbi:MAG: cytochrome c oxidase subunit 3 [Cytophagales bacterium]
MTDIKSLIHKRIKEKNKSSIAKNNLLWFFLSSSFISFLFLTIVYTSVKSGQFQVSPIFYLSTILVVLNSISIHFSYHFYQKDEIEKGIMMLLVSACVTLMFMMSQMIGWSQLFERYFDVLKTNLMLFVLLSGFHFAHILGGLIFVVYLLVSHYQFKIHSKSINGIRNATYYFHALGFVWLALFVLF